MPRQNVIQSSFTAGEVSPKINGRVDTKLFANGAKKIENFIVLPQGGVTRRSGSIKVHPCKFATTSSSYVRLVEWEYSDVNAVVLEFGNGYIRFYQDGHRVYDTNPTYATDDLNRANNGGFMQIRSDNEVDDTPEFTITNVEDAGGVFKITTSTNHTFRTGVKARVKDTGVAAANGEWVITRVSNTAFTLDGSTYGAGWASGGVVLSNGLLPGDEVFLSGTGTLSTLLNGYHVILTVDSYYQVTLANVAHESGTYTSGEYMLSIPLEIDSPYAVADIDELRFVQSADILYIFHPDYAPRKLVRSLFNAGLGNTYLWTLSTVTFKDGPYLPIQDDAPALNSTNPEYGTSQPDVYLELSSYAHTATVTAAAAFDNTDDNRYIEYREGDQWRLAQLGTLAGGETSATVTIIDNVLLHLDETTKFRNTVRIRRGPFENRVTYDAGSPNASPSVPQAGVRQRVDPNNFLRDETAGTAAGTLASNYSNTFGVADVGKYVRYMDGTAYAAAPTNTGRIARWAQIVRVNATGAEAHHSAALTMALNNSTGNFVISAHSRTATVTAKKAGATFALFASTDVGRHIRLGWAGRWTWGIITGYTSTSVVTVTLYEDVPRDPHNAANLAGALVGAITVSSSLVTGLAAGRTYDWRLGAWSGTTGYPSTGCFHEQRLVLGRTDTQPQTFWGSITGDFENFAPTEYDSTVLDDNGYTFTLASGKVNAIKWLESGINLVIGTNGGEWLARSTSATQEPITPTNITVTQQGRNGSSRTALPLRIGSSIVFVSRSEMNVMDVSYLFSEDRLQDKDLTIAAEHIIRQGGTVVQCAYQQNPHMVAWFVLSDGTLAALTYNQEQEVVAWHRHTISGGTVESIAIVPNSTGTEDSIYLAVKRTISAADYRTVELLAPQFYSSLTTPSSRLNMRFMDGHVAGTNNSSATALTVVHGLYHLEGKTVIATVNGTKVGTTYTVTSGSITLAVPITAEFVVGMAFTPILDSLPPEGGSAFGTSQGMKKRVVEMKARVYDTCEFDIYPVADTSSAKKATYNESTATQQFFTGTTPVSPKFNTDIESAWRITTSNPYALTVLAMVLVLETTE